MGLILLIIENFLSICTYPVDGKFFKLPISQIIVGKQVGNAMSNEFDSDDFFQEMADVKPIKQDKVNSPAQQKEELNAVYRQKVAQSFGKAEQNFLTDGDVPPVEPQAILEFKVSGVQPLVFKKLRQGKYDIDFHLDLHRKTVAEARNEVFHLIRDADRLNYRTLLITHGKGIKSNPPAKLKSYVNYWLQQIDVVIGFHSAIAKHGGTGSVYVLLKKPQQPNQINQAKYD